MPASETSSERERFRSLFEQYYPLVLRYFQKRGLPDEEAHDLSQETFLRAFRGWSRFREEASPSTWLYRIAANTFAKELRRRGAEKRSAQEVSLNAATEDGLEPLLESLADEETDGPLDEALRRERLVVLGRAVAALPDQMRTCLELRLRQGLSYQQIAVVLQLSKQTVKAHLFQARKRLKVAAQDT